jgi:hypothetical protein
LAVKVFTYNLHRLLQRFFFCAGFISLSFATEQLLPNQRQDRILEWLQNEQFVSIDQLVKRLGVSIMTVHRDLDQLVHANLIEKVHGGAALPKLASDSGHTTAVCGLCETALQQRTLVTLQFITGEQISFCCPHCALLYPSDSEATALVLGRDFIYGRMVNLGQAFFVVASQISICCVPSVLCFANEDDAQRFKRGFDGAVMSYGKAKLHLADHHRILT